MNPWHGVLIYFGIGLFGWLLSFVCSAGWPDDLESAPGWMKAVGFLGLLASWNGLGASVTRAAILLGQAIGKR